MALGPLLLDEVVFVGGATVALWITDPAAPPARPTLDVDVVIEVTTRLEYERFSGRMRARDIHEDIDSPVICRWRHKPTSLVLDAIPADPSILGFANRWQAAAVPYAVERALPSGRVIRAMTPPYLVAAKLDAFADRGGGDLLASHDLEDIIALVDGRRELVAEIAASPADVKAFIAGAMHSVRGHARFLDGLYGWLSPDAGSQARATSVLLPRVGELIGDT